MKIQLEELKHQEHALSAIMDSFAGIDEYAPDSDNPDYVYANPLIKGRYQEKNNIDIKMETGTGKTFVGTRMMYELHKKYGLFKFIIVVPSPAIKEGWKNFLTADYSRQYFKQFYENISLEVSTLNAGDFKAKSGRKNIPAHLMNFIESDRLNTNKINVLLINDGMLRSKSLKKEYDQSLLSGLTIPLKGLQETRPVVIMDEPHRFPRELKKGKWVGKANYNAVEDLKAQMIVRLGATFNENKKTHERDYYRGKPQFDLNAIESFNQGLVKAVDIYYPMISEEQAKNAYKVKSVTSKELVLSQGGKTFDPLKVGDDLSNVDDGFDGDVTYAGSKRLSNELELEKNMTLIPGTFTESYQELIMRDAIDKHFEKEKENFLRPAGKVKTLSLFFIDSIASFGVKNPNGPGRKMGWLGQMFDRLLDQKLTDELKLAEFAPASEKDYYDFLRATKADIAGSRGAYFGEDRANNDEGIQQEVDDILRNKEKLLSFKDKNGNWNTRRFLFSKWTLREGWDNPNVFVIAKMRTSGSENSKIQEVGRGLRLPVDENGHRLSDEEFRLAFLIGYDEKDFADKLVADINQDAKVKIDRNKLTDTTIKLILKGHPELDEEKLLQKLDDEGIIKRNNDFKDGGFDNLKEEYSAELNTGLQSNKVTSNKKNPKQKLTLKKENWEQLRTLWAKLSKRYMITFDRLPQDVWEIILEDMLAQDDVFQLKFTEQVHQKISVTDEASVNEQLGAYEAKTVIGKMSYGKFLEQLSRQTNLPIQLLLKTIQSYFKNHLKVQNHYEKADYFNEYSLKNFVKAFKKRFAEKFAQKVAYTALDFEAKTTVWDKEHETFFDEVTAGYVGQFEKSDDANEDTALYSEPPLRFDSENPELKLLEYNYDKNVVVFGKLPKKAIKIPKYTGGSTTPDFVYKVGSDLYLLVDTKSDDMRGSEEKTVDIQGKFLGQFDNVRYRTLTSVQDVITELNKLVQGENK